MAKFATHMGDPNGKPQTSPQHADPHGFLVFLKENQKSMWISMLWAGLRVAMWITHVGGKFRHGLPEKSLIKSNTDKRKLPTNVLVHSLGTSENAQKAYTFTPR